MTHRISTRQLVGIVALTLMWGMNWPIMKLSLQYMSPLNFRALTMAIGAVFLFAWVRSQSGLIWPTRHQWPAVIGLMLPNILIWHMASIYGVAELASGRAAILGFTMPIITVLIGVVFLGERLTRRIALACCAAAAAIVLLLWHEFSRLRGSPMGVLYMELAALGWALGTVLMRRRRLQMDAQVLTVWMLLCGAALLSAAALWVGQPIAWSRFPSEMWLSLAYAAFINYGIGQLIWFGLASHLPPATSAMSIMAIPIVGIVSAPLIVGEWPLWQDWAAAAFIVTAIAAALLPTQTRRRSQPPLETACE